MNGFLQYVYRYEVAENGVFTLGESLLGVCEANEVFEFAAVLGHQDRCYRCVAVNDHADPAILWSC